MNGESPAQKIPRSPRLKPWECHQFNQANEAKVAAQQKLFQTHFQAQQVVQQAQAEATAVALRATASRNAQLVQKTSITPQYLRELAISKWDGRLPTYMTGGAQLPFLAIAGQ